MGGDTQKAGDMQRGVCRVARWWVGTLRGLWGQRALSSFPPPHSGAAKGGSGEDLEAGAG